MKEFHDPSQHHLLSICVQVVQSTMLKLEKWVAGMQYYQLAGSNVILLELLLPSKGNSSWAPSQHLVGVCS